MPGLDLSDLSGLVPAADVVRRAARNVSPLSMTRPSAWMLRDAIAKAQGFQVGQIFPRATMDQLLAPIIRAFVGPGDHVGLVSPCRCNAICNISFRFTNDAYRECSALYHDLLLSALVYPFTGCSPPLIQGTFDINAAAIKHRFRNKFLV